MLLLRIHPDKFSLVLEMFVDGCDWLMVPNLYGMCQLGDVVHGSTQYLSILSDLAMSGSRKGIGVVLGCPVLELFGREPIAVANQKCMSIRSIIRRWVR